LVRTCIFYVDISAGERKKKLFHLFQRFGLARRLSTTTKPKSLNGLARNAARREKQDVGNCSQTGMEREDTSHEETAGMTELGYTIAVRNGREAKYILMELTMFCNQKHKFSQEKQVCFKQETGSIINHTSFDWL
jgi:hypothetical protein